MPLLKDAPKKAPPQVRDVYNVDEIEALCAKIATERAQGKPSIMKWLNTVIFNHLVRDYPKTKTILIVRDSSIPDDELAEACLGDISRMRRDLSLFGSSSKEEAFNLLSKWVTEGTMTREEAAVRSRQLLDSIPFPPMNLKKDPDVKREDKDEFESDEEEALQHKARSMKKKISSWNSLKDKLLKEASKEKKKEEDEAPKISLTPDIEIPLEQAKDWVKKKMEANPDKLAYALLSVDIAPSFEQEVWHAVDWMVNYLDEWEQFVAEEKVKADEKIAKGEKPKRRRPHSGEQKDFSRFTLAEACKHADQWTETMNRRIETINDAKTVREVFRFEDGFKLVQLTTKDEFKREGKLMSHCVGSHSYCDSWERGGNMILSLRDEENEPHVTIECNLAAPSVSGQFLIISPDNIPYVEERQKVLMVYQVKSKSNYFDPKYAPYIKKLDDLKITVGALACYGQARHNRDFADDQEGAVLRDEENDDGGWEIGIGHGGGAGPGGVGAAGAGPYGAGGGAGPQAGGGGAAPGPGFISRRGHYVGPPVVEENDDGERDA